MQNVFQKRFSFDDHYLEIGVNAKRLHKYIQLQLVRKQDLGDAVILDADANTVTTMYDDLATLPKEVVSCLLK